MKNLRMKAARVGCDLSQEELAAKVGVTRQTIGMIEAGRFNPSLALCVAICRALMQNPGILLADEPVASLDPKNTQRIMDVLREISEQGISVMVNLHSVELVKAYCTRVIGVASGQLIFDDHPSRLTQDVLQRLYGDEVSQLH